MPEEEKDTLLKMFADEWENTGEPLLWLIYSAAALANTPNEQAACVRADRMVKEFEKRFLS